MLLKNYQYQSFFSSSFGIICFTKLSLVYTHIFDAIVIAFSATSSADRSGTSINARAAATGITNNTKEQEQVVKDAITKHK